jgi:hypothetical protein
LIAIIAGCATLFLDEIHSVGLTIAIIYIGGISLDFFAISNFASYSSYIEQQFFGRACGLKQAALNWSTMILGWCISAINTHYSQNAFFIVN